MFSIRTAAVPENGLLHTYASRQGCYTDCYYADVPKHVLLEELIFAFFTTPVFRLERKLLGLCASHPSTTADVENLASGASDTLAFWKVEAREESQLIMIVAEGPIRSWLMVEPLAKDQNRTRLYFGSAVLTRKNKKTGEVKMDLLFYSLRGFHKIYSRILLGLARRRILSGKR
jgi:hypothetical protein